MTRNGDERADGGRADDQAWAAAPRVALSLPEDPTLTLLRQLSSFVLAQPVAAQAIFAGLVTEGRRFAATAEGERWRAALADSELVRRGRALWEGSVLNMLEDAPDAVLPSAMFDALVQAATQGDLPMLLRELAGDRFE